MQCEFCASTKGKYAGQKLYKEIYSSWISNQSHNTKRMRETVKKSKKKCWINSIKSLKSGWIVFYQMMEMNSKMHCSRVLVFGLFSGKCNRIFKCHMIVGVCVNVNALFESLNCLVHSFYGFFLNFCCKANLQSKYFLISDSHWNRKLNGHNVLVVR